MLFLNLLSDKGFDIEDKKSILKEEDKFIEIREEVKGSI
jgi:hypothetical protein